MSKKRLAARKVRDSLERCSIRATFSQIDHLRC